MKALTGMASSAPWKRANERRGVRSPVARRFRQWKLAKTCSVAGTFAVPGDEAIITLMVEAVWSKRRIFEVYLNVIRWGNGVFGAKAAARHYYGLGAAQLGPTGGTAGGDGPQSALYRPLSRAAPGLARKAEVILAGCRRRGYPEPAFSPDSSPFIVCVATIVWHFCRIFFPGFPRGQLPQ